MTSAVDLVNRALSAIGTQSQIQALTENSTEALHASLHYDPIRRELLRKYRWGFARRAAVPLALLKAAAGTSYNPSGLLPTPPVPWVYEYAKPADMLLARRILPIIPPSNLVPPLTGGTSITLPIPSGPPVKFTRAVDYDANNNPVPVILTNQDKALLDYTADISDPNQFDDLFQMALVGRLAAVLVTPLAGDKALAKIAIDDGARVEAEAAAKDAQETVTIIDHVPEWIRGRGYATDLGSTEGIDFWPGGFPGLPSMMD